MNSCTVRALRWTQAVDEPHPFVFVLQTTDPHAVLRHVRKRFQVHTGGMLTYFRNRKKRVPTVDARQSTTVCDVFSGTGDTNIIVEIGALHVLLPMGGTLLAPAHASAVPLHRGKATTTTSGYWRGKVVRQEIFCKK